MQSDHKDIREGLTPPSINGYTEFCKSNDLMEYAFPRSTSFCEIAAISAAYAQSDQGRYKMKMLFVGDSQALLPCYFSSLGHEVWLLDQFKNTETFELYFNLKQKFDFIMIRDSFLRWHPKAYTFRMVLFIDYLSKMFFSDRHNCMSDSADTIAIAKARSIKIAAGVVFFTVELIDRDKPDQYPQMVLESTKRYYSFQEIKDRLLNVCDQVGTRFRDNVSPHTSWLVR